MRRSLVQQRAMGQTLTWTRDGSHVLFGQSGQYATPDFGVNYMMRVPAIGGVPEATGLQLRGRYVSLDPTGTRIVFESRHAFDPELWVIDQLVAPGSR